ncbi:V-type ATP synthase subunit F [Cloacibacillus sp. An23]|uniref:V-type ATP synthase subunit F n=1 Tax=Cloacibacillus sp. An23 TaxID=1965591 RepID=UPI000B381984|nr:V-type ATP synthase subunit F [Cloacibacillus sp. An23]OUO94877.1 V-type ATP synthase subunit F [Cloacibacillus sp. An23]
MSAHKQRAPMAAVGSYESILPFKAIGLDVVIVTEENNDAVPQTLNKFARAGYAALFLEEALYAKFTEAVDEINEYSDISIIPVPNQSGSMNVGLRTIRRNVERAVGMDIFGDK